MAPFIQQYWPLLATTGGLLAFVLIGLLLLREGPAPYERRGGLLTPAEITFLRSLELAVRSDWQIFSMVRVADVLKVRPKTRKFQSWQNRIFGKHVDFVICDIDTLEVKLAIELDDTSHRRSDRVARDRFLNSAFASAGLPLLRVPVEERYETAEVRRMIEDTLGIARKKKKW